MTVGEALVIDAQEVQDGGMQVADVHGIGRDVVTEVVGGAVGVAGFDAASRHPHGEAAGMMVAPGFRAVPLALAGDAAAELSAPDDEGVVQQATSLEVGDERGARLVGVATARGAP